MATLAQTPHHRKAYGAHRVTTPAHRAQSVAQSIALREDEGRAWTWAEYGFDGNIAQQKRVEKALAKLQWTADEEERLAAWYWEQEQARLEELERLDEDGD